MSANQTILNRELFIQALRHMMEAESWTRRADGTVRTVDVLPAYRALAREAGCTPAQLALAWLLAQGEDILPIPGTSRIEHLRDNLGAAALHLSADLIQRVGALINEKTVVGSRYSAQSQSEVDTETFSTATPAQG